MGSSMPTASRHPGSAFPLFTELALTLLSRLTRQKWAATSVNFSTQRVGIASAICIRNHGTSNLDECAPEVDQWLRLTSLSYERKLLLIQAGVPVALALADETREWEDSTLRTMIVLRRMAERTRP